MFSLEPVAAYQHRLVLDLHPVNAPDPLAQLITQRVKELDRNMFTKSGIMVGLGETREQVMQVMDDMRAADIDFITIGQYLQPTRKHAAIDRFVTPDEFKGYGTIAYAKGFLMVASSPLTRSSYHADDDFAKLRDAREAQALHAAAQRGHRVGIAQRQRARVARVRALHHLQQQGGILDEDQMASLADHLDSAAFKTGRSATPTKTAQP